VASEIRGVPALSLRPPLSARSSLHFEPDTVLIHPRELAKFALATDTTNRYLFEGGLARQFENGVSVVADANIPTDLGAGTDESEIIVGNFQAGGYFFERQPLTIDVDLSSGFVTDQTAYRGVERFGARLCSRTLSKS
jgi:HK97 family phage major capsid protein